MSRTLVIFGTSTSLREWNFDRVKDQRVEFWGCNNMYRTYPALFEYASRWFEMHRLAYLDTIPNDHVAQLAKFTGPVYMLEQTDRVPTSRAYPLAIVNKTLRALGGTEGYFTSTFSYQLALAIHEGFDEVHFYGVDFYEEGERVFERPGLEYLIGLAQGVGVKVVLPSSCPLLTTPYLYGYEEPRMRLEDVRPVVEFLEQLEVSLHASADEQSVRDDEIGSARARATAKTLHSVQTWLRYYGRAGSLLNPDWSVNEEESNAPRGDA